METAAKTREYYGYDEVREWPMVDGWSVCPDTPYFKVSCHHEARIGPSVLFGRGAKVKAEAVVEAGAVVGSRAVVGPNAKIRYDAGIGSGAVVEADAVAGA